MRLRPIIAGAVWRDYRRAVFAIRHQSAPGRQTWLAVALLLLGLRLLSPGGFMPQWGSAGFSLGLCDGIAVPAPAHHEASDRHDGKHHGQPGEQDTQSHNPCPYAAAAGAAALASLPRAPVQPYAFEAGNTGGSDTPALLRHRVLERPRSRAPPLSA